MTSFELEEEENLISKKQEALKRGITKLSKRCQHLFNTILETGIEKSSQLFERLGLENARAVTVLRYDCTKQLKIKAAIELEQLLR